MRVLFLSVTAGEGHNSCAKAAMAVLEKRGDVCRLLDTISYVSSIAGAGINKGYQMLGKVSPTVFGKMYETALTSSIKQTGPRAEDLVTDGMARKLADYIADFAPDCIVTTHVFAALVLTHLRNQDLCNTLVIGINTDFSIHPFWEQVRQDYFVLACKEMRYAAHVRKIPEEIILPYGLPVQQKFTKKIQPADARRQLGITDKMTLTIMSGSMGFGHLLRHIQELDKLPLDFQIIAICGNNKDAYKKIEEAREKDGFGHEVMSHGFVNNVDAYMSAGDILVTKPGGLSTSECLNVGRPLVLVEPIPGLEHFNASFLVNCGAAVYANDYYPLEEAVYNLVTSPGRRASMMQAQEAIHPGNAAVMLADSIEQKIVAGIDNCSLPSYEK